MEALSGTAARDTALRRAKRLRPAHADAAAALAVMSMLMTASCLQHASGGPALQYQQVRGTRNGTRGGMTRQQQNGSRRPCCGLYDAAAAAHAMQSSQTLHGNLLYN